MAKQPEKNDEQKIQDLAASQSAIDTDINEAIQNLTNAMGFLNKVVQQLETTLENQPLDDATIDELTIPKIIH